LTPELLKFIREHQEQVETALRRDLPVSSKPGTGRFNKALHYAVFPGGKRLRPIIALLAGRLVGVDHKAMPSACAIEFLHSSSLILDDLPGMDDADMRRNKTALHLVFGEGLAVLAAVALLNQAYALFGSAARELGCEHRIAALLVEATSCIGANGMIGGQVIDLESNATLMNQEVLTHRDAKTIALMRLMMTCNALAAGASSDDCAALAGFGEYLGAAYQICDDLLDELAASSLTGKTPGQDSRHWRPSAVAELGHHDAYRLAVAQVENGKALLVTRFGNVTEVRLLCEIADLIPSKVPALSRFSESPVALSMGLS
jgi:geranylgeranyl diphosphate synthase type II